jgi:GxxExxY protein
METGEDRVNLLSKRIIGCALTVLHALGAGFLEKVYENSLAHELRKSGLAVSQQHPMVVRYDGVVVGEYTVDLFVEHIVLVELKVARAIDDIHRKVLLHSLELSDRATELLALAGIGHGSIECALHRSCHNHRACQRAATMQRGSIHASGRTRHRIARHAQRSGAGPTRPAPEPEPMSVPWNPR